MLNIRNRRSVKRSYLLPLILLSFIAVICLAFTIAGNKDFDIARREVLLRRLGHEVLLQSGDSTSRVLPVKKMGAHEYRISFEKAFTFQADSLVNTARRVLAADPLTGDYIVNVLTCSNTSITYGFAISSDNKNDVIACKGRIQPAACYMIDIKFEQAEINTIQKISLLGGLPVLAFIGVIFLRSVKRRTHLPDDKDNSLFYLGSVLFDADKRTLLINENTIELTGTEARVLRVFASTPNEIIERSRLQKEIWEDEGVIVGRSLDMFISKLRKKLDADSQVKIVVVRGKGYRLETHS